MLKENELRQKLRALRTERGLTESDVAARLGKAGNSYVNRIENGPTKLNVEILDELCRLYQISPVELFRSNQTQEKASHEPRGFFEKSVFRGDDTLEEGLREKIKQLLPTLRKIGEVQALLGKEPFGLEDVSNDLAGVNLKSPFAAKAKARDAAVTLRKFFKIDENSALDIVLFCWNYLNVPVAGLDLGPNCWGLHSSDKFGNPLIIYSSVNKFAQRNVFTIAHEIGHYLFAHDYLSVDCDGNEKNIIEAVADTFAQELLVPTNALRSVFDELGLSLVSELKPRHVVMLCEHFKVSFYMMAFCLFQASKISRNNYDALREFCLNDLGRERNGLGYYPEDYFTPVKSLKDQLRELTLIALRKERIGFFEASRLLDEPTAELKAAL